MRIVVSTHDLIGLFNTLLKPKWTPNLIFSSWAVSSNSVTSPPAWYTPPTHPTLELNRLTGRLSRYKWAVILIITIRTILSGEITSLLYGNTEPRLTLELGAVTTYLPNPCLFQAIFVV